ncbi:MAG TPA: hypothetical protein VGM68_10795 [Rhizomicrobium sp.]|jgi:flagellar biogenesis protein FliO
MPAPSPEDQDNQDTKTLAGLAVAIVIVLIAVFALMKFKQSSALLDCVAAGHHNCEPADTSAM